ncbi:MAG TPA: NAD(P)-dependent oxidoreductase [Myxococcota bacterium]|nr:NAD(P)-dependent oxidoreductase [Myxococcota bacterium]
MSEAPGAASRPLRVLSHLPGASVLGFTGPLPGVEILDVPTQGEPPPEASGEVLLTFAWGSPNLAQVASRGVRWIHTIGTGVDRFPLDVVGDRILTCSRGASAIPIAEWVLAMLLAFAKQLPESWIDEPVARWNQADLGGLAGRTLGLLGLGGIATAVATRALAFEMRVLALRRSPGPSGIPGVEIARDLRELLGASDHLVIAASSTAETRHLIGREAFAAARPGLHLVNIARGAIVDQEALREALDSGRVARASLDVCDPEPLPAGHWLYAHPRVRLSPHISWSAPEAMPRLFETFRENLRRYRAGEPLEGRVDLERGY